VRKLANGDQELQELTREAHSIRAEINRIYYDSPVEAQRLFEELVPGAGVGIDFRPPINIDYGMRLSIGDRTFINADLLIIGGGFVTIGDNVWLGGSVTITPGVIIGDNSIIGAGSVVTKDIPANTIAVGNPCRPIKPIPES